MTVVQLVLVSVFPACVIAAALTDATSYTIPNRLSAFLAVAFVPAALAMGMSPLAFAISLGMGVAGLALGIAMFALRWIGGGDAKLLAACALWLGLGAITPFLLWTGVAGGVLALGLMGLRKFPAPLAASGPPWFGRLMKPGGDVPYGVAIAVGALFALPHASILNRLHGA
ncbi:MAG: prepilin peptidase [Caulobacteraceae bacterium]